MISDISKLKKTEKDLKKFNENLEQIVAERTIELNEAIEELNATNEIIELKSKELEKLSIVASETDNAITIMDNLGNFQWVNNAFTKKYGMTVENLISQKGKDIITATKSIDLTNIVYNVLAEKKSYHYEIEEINKKGIKIYTQTTLTPIFDENNEVKNIIAINTDISEIKEKENELMKKAVEMSDLIEELNITNEIIESVNQEVEQRNEEITQQQEELITQRDTLAVPIIKRTSPSRLVATVSACKIPSLETISLYFSISLEVFETKLINIGFLSP